jgi:hypothetical protein
MMLIIPMNYDGFCSWSWHHGDDDLNCFILTLRMIMVMLRTSILYILYKEWIGSYGMIPGVVKMIPGFCRGNLNSEVPELLDCIEQGTIGKFRLGWRSWVENWLELDRLWVSWDDSGSQKEGKYVYWDLPTNLDRTRTEIRCILGPMVWFWVSVGVLFDGLYEFWNPWRSIAKIHTKTSNTNRHPWDAAEIGWRQTRRHARSPPSWSRGPKKAKWTWLFDVFKK